MALRFAVGIALIQVGWVLRLASDGRRSATSTFIVLGLLELAIPYWAERSGPMTPWHPGHIVERYGLFTIIVLGECVLATMTATQVAFEAGGRLGPLLAVAAGGLILVFALWWSYFKHEPDVSRRRSLGATIAWGYGHYFVFAAVAALGAGLQVAADTTHDATDLDAGRRGPDGRDPGRHLSRRAGLPPRPAHASRSSPRSRSPPAWSSGRLWPRHGSASRRASSRWGSW